MLSLIVYPIILSILTDGINKEQPTDNVNSSATVVWKTFLRKMVYDIKNKIVLITGAASGIGLAYAKELLRNGVKVPALLSF